MIRALLSPIRRVLPKRQPPPPVDKRTPNQKAFDRREVDAPELPDIVYIETAMACNLRCGFCPVPTSRQSMGGRTPALMSDEVFRAVMESIADRPRHISFNLMGEPLLHKQIDEFVATAKAQGHTAEMTSNAALLTEERARALLAAGLDQVTFSFDGADKATYEKLRVRGHFDEVVENIRRFARLRGEMGVKCRIIVDCISSDVTAGTEGAFRALWEGTADEVRFIPLSDWSGQFDLPDELGANRATNRADAIHRHPCHLLWTTVAVSAEGKVTYCCHDYKLKSGLPSVLEKPLRDIWREDVGVERDRHIKGDYAGSSCEHCDAWKAMPAYYNGPG